MRADVNVSVRKHGEPYRTRCEVKNVNSIRFVMQAIEAEAKRQVEVWESGGTVEQETRLFDSSRGMTRSMRSKEDAHDYRYFPDPDLLPLVLDEAWVDELKAALPELPDAKQRALHARLWADGVRCRRAGRRTGDRRFLRDGRQGSRCQDRRQLGDGRSVRRTEPHRPHDRGHARLRGVARQACSI